MFKRPQPARLWAAALLVAAATANAHPGVGIVQDSRGNVFFTDLKQVWKVAPDGKKSVAVPNVHTHELCLDSEDNLYGDHLWGEAGGWRHRVWCLHSEGTLRDVIPRRDGFLLRDYSFVRDRAGNMYWADSGEKAVIKKTSPAGGTVTHATAVSRMVQWMTATPEGTLFLMDGPDLQRILPDGNVTTVVTKLSGHNPAPAAVSERNYHMGLWTDREGAVYVAVARARIVLKVQPHGKTTVAARSEGGWAPSGGMFGRDESLWLLEYDGSNAVRARHIERDGKARTY